MSFVDSNARPALDLELDKKCSHYKGMFLPRCPELRFGGVQLLLGMDNWMIFRLILPTWRILLLAEDLDLRCGS